MLDSWIQWSRRGGLSYEGWWEGGDELSGGSWKHRRSEWVRCIFGGKAIGPSPPGLHFFFTYFSVAPPHGIMGNYRRPLCPPPPASPLYPPPPPASPLREPIYATVSGCRWLEDDTDVYVETLQCTRTIDINRTPVSKTRPLSSYQLTHDKVMQAWASDIHAAARQEPTGGPVFILYSTQSSSYI